MLAALVFMGIVIPVAVHGLQIANRAGQVAQRKGDAARVAERILNETIIMTNWNKASQSGSAVEGSRQFEWSLRTETWQDPMRLVSVRVNYEVQGRKYDVRLSTLVDTTQGQ